MDQGTKPVLDSGKGHLRWQRWIENLLLLVASSAFVILCLEFVVFRFILVAPDDARSAFVNGVLKYEPNQRGRTGRPPKTFNFNNQGWKSAHQNYTLEKAPGKFRIAIIGDSFVNAGRVDYDQSLAEQLERQLGSDRYEVYRFGKSGVPLSQYLHVFRKEVMPYRPDMTVFVLVHNDFHESYNTPLGRYAEAIMRLKIVDGQVVDEIEPKGYQKPWFVWLMRTATYRYLVKQRGLNIRLIKDFFNRQRLKKTYQANIDISNIEKRAKYNYIATKYLFEKINQGAATIRTHLLLIMDGDRRSIYNQVASEELYKTGALRLNRMARQLAQQLMIPYLDLHPIFEQHYKIHQQWFNPPDDFHWNELGHTIAADAIASHLTLVR